MIKELIKFYKIEQASLKKSDSFLRKIYKNRVEDNLNWEREIIIFLVDKIGEFYFSNHDQISIREYVDKLIFGFNILVGKKELKESILNNLEYRKANLK